jgi:hypothetical protein
LVWQTVSILVNSSSRESCSLSNGMIIERFIDFKKMLDVRIEILDLKFWIDWLTHPIFF